VFVCDNGLSAAAGDKAGYDERYSVQTEIDDVRFTNNYPVSINTMLSFIVNGC
jgi:hypothetical protein